VIIEVMEATDEDAVRILPYLRERELSFLASKDEAPHKIIMAEIARSLLAYTITVDGEPAVIWGVRLNAMLDDKAYIWMLGSTYVDKHKIAFLRHSRKAVHAIAKRFSTLYGLVEYDFDASERWLRWMGCEIVGDYDTYRVFKLEGK
jgi:hypothetical protein